MKDNLNIEEQCKYLFEMVQEKEDAPPWALGLKLGEEMGEFQQNLLHTYGHLHQKEMDEDIFGEAADVINTVIGVLGTLYPFQNSDELVERLQEAMYNKGTKYERLLDKNIRLRQHGS